MDGKFCILFLFILVHSLEESENPTPPIFPYQYLIQYTRTDTDNKRIPLIEQITEYYDFENQTQRFDVKTVVRGVPDDGFVVLQRWDLQMQYNFPMDLAYCYPKRLSGWNMQPPDFLSNFSYGGQNVVDGISCYQWDDYDGCSMFTRIDNADPMRMISAEYVLQYDPLEPGPQDPSLFSVPSICGKPLLPNDNLPVFFPYYHSTSKRNPHFNSNQKTLHRNIKL